MSYIFCIQNLDIYLQRLTSFLVILKVLVNVKLKYCNNDQPSICFDLRSYTANVYRALQGLFMIIIGFPCNHNRENKKRPCNAL